MLRSFRIDQLSAEWGRERGSAVTQRPPTLEPGQASALTGSGPVRTWKTLAEEMLVAGEEGEPCPAPLHSPRLVGAGLSADTSSAPLLGFYLWGQGDQWATETETRDQTALPRWA